MRGGSRAVAIILVVILVSWIAPLRASATSTIELTNTVAENQENIQRAIGEASPGGRVVVTGTQSHITAGLTLNIPSGVVVEWQAFYIGAPGEYLIRLTGDGKFEVTGQAWIENTGSGISIFAPAAAGSTGNAQIVVSGGVVAANSGNAIMAQGPLATVTVQGTGSVFNNAANNIRPAINLTGLTSGDANNSPINVNDNVFILGGSVASISLDGSGYAIQTYGNVIVESPSSIFVINGRCINLVGMDSVATINGGTVEAIGTGTAISTATTTPQNVARARIVVNGGTVRADNGMAINITGADSSILITGGEISNASASTSGNAAINATGINSRITIDDTLGNPAIKAEISSQRGRAINIASSASNTILSLVSGDVTADAGNAIHAIGAVNSVNISGGRVFATTGDAVHLSGTGSLNISGGQIETRSRYAVWANTAGTTVTMSGGTVFAYGPEDKSPASINDVIRNPGFVTGGGQTGSGILIAWKSPEITRYPEGSRNELFIHPASYESMVHWTGGGIDVTFGTNEFTFIRLSVEVYAYYGLIFDVTNGTFYRNVDGTFKLTQVNLDNVFTLQRDNYKWDSGTGTLTLRGFSWHSEMAELDSMEEHPEMQVALYILSSLSEQHSSLTIVLEEGSENTFIANLNNPIATITMISGVFVEETVSEVTITGSGKFVAAGGDLAIENSASVGFASVGSNITIEGGVIEARGGNADLLSVGMGIMALTEKVEDGGMGRRLFVADEDAANEEDVAEDSVDAEDASNEGDDTIEADAEPEEDLAVEEDATGEENAVNEKNTVDVENNIADETLEAEEPDEIEETLFFDAIIETEALAEEAQFDMSDGIVTIEETTSNESADDNEEVVTVEEVVASENTGANDEVASEEVAISDEVVANKEIVTSENVNASEETAIIEAIAATEDIVTLDDVAYEEIVLKPGSLTITGGYITAIGGSGSVGSIGIEILNSDFTIFGDMLTLTAIGGPSAGVSRAIFPFAPTELPQSYAYWVNSEPNRPAESALGTWVFPGNDNADPNLENDFRYVRIDTRPAAVVSNDVVGGVVGKELAGVDNFIATITIFGATIAPRALDNEIALRWFTNLPNGVIALATAELGEKSIQLRFFGTPFETASNVPFNILIPGDLLSSGVDLSVLLNPNAVFNIVRETENEPSDPPAEPPANPPVMPPVTEETPVENPPSTETPECPNPDCVIPDCNNPDCGSIILQSCEYCGTLNCGGQFCRSYPSVEKYQAFTQAQRSRVPQTGDSQNLLLPIILIIIGTAVVVLAEIYRRKFLKQRK